MQKVKQLVTDGAESSIHVPQIPPKNLLLPIPPCILAPGVTHLNTFNQQLSNTDKEQSVAICSKEPQTHMQI